MKYTIKGNLAAYLCEECREHLSNVIIRIYNAQNYDHVPDLVAANEKDTLKLLSDEEVANKRNALLAETKTDDEGNFSVSIANDNYNGGAVELDVYCERVPGQKRKDAKPRQFSITTFQPKWRETNDGLVAPWSYVLPYRFWCYILSLFDVWVICGRVLNCQNNNIPIIGVKVTAMDADWITDDKLGSAITDASGRFKIYYTSKDFKQTFLSPIINVETPFPPYHSGPDVYFIVESSGGTKLLEETRSDGQKPGRRNIGNCYCIKLCINKPVDDDNPTMISAWTGIGIAFTIPDSSGLNSFDADGFAGAQKFAFTGTIRFTGQAPHKINGNPIEYRFLVSDAAGVNGAPFLPASAFTKIIGVDAGLFVPTRIGQMWRYFPNFKIVDIYAEQSDLDGDGWLDVNNSILRTFTTNPTLNPAELSTPGLWNWVDLDGMIALNTGALTSAPNVPDSAASAGQHVPAANKIPTEKIAVRFEIREVINKPANQFNYLPGSGQTLNAMVINNNPSFKKLVMDGHQTAPCKPLSGQVKALYTGYHPYIDSVQLRIKKNGGSYTSLSDINLPVTNNTNNALDEVVNNGLLINGPYPLSKCTYIVRFEMLLRLHNGDGQVSWTTIDTSFYYE